MKKIFLFVFTALFLFSACNSSEETEKEGKKDTFVEDNYTIKEVDIKMRDGTKLHTVIFSPKIGRAHV